jgi:hypothetical protein
MSRKIFFSCVLILLLVLVSACSSLAASAGLAVNGTSATAEAAKSAVTNNLGIGILLLEGSEVQVSVDQASSMLLLWKGVKLLTSDKNASVLELAALYEQIQENLTAEQIASIGEISYTQQDVDLVMQKYAGDSITAASVKKTTSSSSSNSSFGGPGGPGGPGGDMAVISGMSSGATGSSSTTTSAQAKAIAASKSSSTSAGLNAQLADTVIALLQQRAGLS